MNIYTVLTIGEHHVNFCEDYFLTANIGEHRQLIGVFDGCSMGNESHFAAILTAKILKKIAVEMDFLSFSQQQNPDIKNLLKQTLKRLFDELNTIKNLLLLSKYDLLNTVLVGILDTQTHQAALFAVGDGVVVADNQTFVFDQNNQPDYIGYHLQQNFDDWFSQQKQYIKLENWKDISISTDGIFTFKKYNNQVYEQKIETIDYLCKDRQFEENKNMLGKKVHILATEYGLKPTDDLAIIRVIR